MTSMALEEYVPPVAQCAAPGWALRSQEPQARERELPTWVANPLHKEGRRDRTLRPGCQGLSWKTPDFSRLWVYKRSGVPLLRVPPWRHQLQLLFCDLIIASWLNCLKDLDVWNCCGNPGIEPTGNLVCLWVWGVQLRWGLNPSSGAASVAGRQSGSRVDSRAVSLTRLYFVTRVPTVLSKLPSTCCLLRGPVKSGAVLFPVPGWRVRHRRVKTSPLWGRAGPAARGQAEAAQCGLRPCGGAAGKALRGGRGAALQRLGLFRAVRDPRETGAPRCARPPAPQHLSPIYALNIKK